MMGLKTMGLILAVGAQTAGPIQGQPIQAQLMDVQLQAWLKDKQGELDACVLVVRLTNASGQRLKLTPSAATVTGPKLPARSCTFYAASSWKPGQRRVDGKSFDFVLSPGDTRIVRMVFFCHDAKGKRAVVRSDATYRVQHRLSWAGGKTELEAPKVVPQAAPSDEGGF